MQYNDLLSKQKNTLNTISQKQNKKIKSIFVNGKSFIHAGRVVFKEIEGLNNEPTSKKPSKVEPALKSSKKRNTNKHQKKPEAWRKNEDLVNLDRVFVDGKRSTSIHGKNVNEFNPRVKDPNCPKPSTKKFSKDSPVLLFHLNMLTKENRPFFLGQDLEKAGGLIVYAFPRIEIADPINLDRKFVDGKRSFSLDGELFEEVDTPVKYAFVSTPFKKTSSNLKSALKKLKKNKESFRVEQNPKEPNGLIVYRFSNKNVKPLGKKLINEKRYPLIDVDFSNDVKAKTKKTEPVAFINKMPPKLQPHSKSKKKKNVFPDIEYPNNLERKFIDGKRSLIIDGDLFEEVEALGKTPEAIFPISKKSFNLKPTLESFKKKNRTFRLDQDPKNLDTWLIHSFKPDPIKANIRVKNIKRNTFCTLSTLDEKPFSTTSIGQVKKRKKDDFVSIKGRERQSSHNIRAIGLLVQKEILKHNVVQIRLHHTGNAPNKKKKEFLKCIKEYNSIQIDEINRPAPRSHNGARPRKIRRK